MPCAYSSTWYLLRLQAMQHNEVFVLWAHVADMREITYETLTLTSHRTSQT